MDLFPLHSNVIILTGSNSIFDLHVKQTLFGLLNVESMKYT